MAQMRASGLPTIGDVVLAWRKYRGLRSTELVRKAGIKKGYLSALEHNKRTTPQEAYLEKLADALGVPLQDIYGRRMPPKDGEDGGTSSAQPGKGGKGGTKRASKSTVLRAPLAVSPQKVLVRRLALLEKKLEAVEKSLHEAFEELRDIAALVTDMQSEE